MPKEKQINADNRYSIMNLLSIGGSDPTTGAGIQSDIKTFTELNAHPLTVITAVTGQNTKDFGLVQQVSKKVLENQMNAIMSDFKVDGIKIGMVYSSEVIKILYGQLKGCDVPIVVDPVIESTTGGILMKREAMADYRKYIVPLGTVITPNQTEAEILTKTNLKDDDRKDNDTAISNIAKSVQRMGAENVIVTGISKGAKIIDFVLERDGSTHSIPSKKISNINHGSGCNYSAAMISAIADGATVYKAAKFAKKFTYNSIKNAKNIGKGITITNVGNQDVIALELAVAINEFADIKDIYKNIPECQTNFVYSKNRPRTTQDVLGISGRIVKAKKDVIVAGELVYGGSKHVATALLAMNKKFPQIRSAVNLRYHDTIISKINKSRLVVSSYDRAQEPANVKNGGSTIRWGINCAIKRLERHRIKTMAPDVIFHKGDFGKEPMIIVFGETPKNVLEKLAKIL